MKQRRTIWIRLVLAAVAVAGATAAGAQQMPERRLVRKGNRQFARGAYEQSMERYGRALEKAPGNYEATYDLGNALYKAGQYDKAEERLKAAAADSTRSEAERAEAFYNLGNAQFQQQRYSEALESYKQSMRMDPDDREAKYNYAYTKRFLEQNEQQNQQQQQQDQQQNQQNQQNQQDQQQNRQQGQQGAQQQDQQQQDQQQQDQQQGEQEQQPAEQQQGEGRPTPSGISPEEQERMLDAIQAQEDRTQEKLKEMKGVVVRGKKNW